MRAMILAARRVARTHRALAPPLLVALCACMVLASGCSTGQPRPLSAQALQEAETFPYYPIYWVGRNFGSYPLTAADGKKGYSSAIGDSVYYGDCVRDKGILGGGSCQLPLQVTTVIYRLHSNATLGTQRNALIRGVPAVIYDEGHSIELYSGRQAIDIFSDTFAHAMQAAEGLRPLNAPGSATGPLPAPVYCPGLTGPRSKPLRRTMSHLPEHACQSAAAIEASTSGLAP
ncbi:MAG TPA: hypothetical protein VIC06_07800 [Solirubrobacteraceae bacterium]|jgi:hypothetical protein